MGSGRGNEPAEIYTALRSRALTVTPADLGELPTTPPVLAVVMDTGYPEAVATLIALADGTTSLYFSNGGGMIGGGEHPQIAAAAQRLVEVAVRVLGHLAQANDFPLPPEGMTQLIAVTPGGSWSANVAEAELGSGGHELSVLFFAAQDVITELRLVDEERSG
jgi:hypothetical protein